MYPVDDGTRALHRPRGASLRTGKFPDTIAFDPVGGVLAVGTLGGGLWVFESAPICEDPDRGIACTMTGWVANDSAAAVTEIS